MKAVQALQAEKKISIHNILFATDFSPAADLAAPFAMQIAKTYGAKIYGVHVHEIENYATASPQVWAMMAEAAEKEAHEKARRLNEQLEGVEHHVSVHEGNIWEVISRLIDEKKIDLVVLGTHGRKGFGKALLGSVAERILRQAKCPVLTVGPNALLTLGNTLKLREIIYATDLSAEFPAAAAYASSLAQENQAHLGLLYVIEEQKTGDLVQPREIADAKMRMLGQLVPEGADLWCKPECLVAQGDPAEKILEVAEKQKADLIVLGARPGKWFAAHLDAGTVHKVVTEARCPVLTVHT